ASASRDRSLDWRRRLQVIAYAAALGVCVQCYNRGVTRVLKAIRRGITAAVAAYIEDRGGMKLFTLEEDLDDGHPHALRTPFARYAARYARSGLKSGGASPHGEEHSPTSPLAGPDSSDSGSTKFFSCLEAEDVRGLYAGTGRVTLGPHEPLFNAGDPSESGIFIVPRGGGADPSTDRLLVNVLVYGESVGDLDVLDGAPRAASAAALAEGCTLVQVPRDLFLNFILARPATLLVYLQKAMARLWRVSHFVLSDFLQLPLEDFKGLEMDGETGIREASWEQLAAGLGRRRVVAPMEQLHDQDALVHAFYVVLEGTLVATRVREGQEPRTASVLPGSLVSCAAFLSSTRTKCEFAAGGEPCLLAGFGARELNSLLYDDSDSLANLASPQPSGVWSPCFGASPSGQSPAREPPPPTDAPAPLSSTLKSAVYIDLLLGAARALGPVVRQFTSLGLNRVWLHAGDVVYRQGDVAECMYVVISGRARLLHRASRGREVGVEDDVGRGESMGAVWALAGGRHDTSAICIRDAELCRLTRGSFELLCALHPRAAARVLQGMAERLAASQSNRGRGGVAGVQRETLDATSLGETAVWKKGGNRRRGEIVTIAVLPAGRVSGGASAMDPVTRLATELRGTLELMWGPTLLLDAASIAAAFPTTHARLKSSFHRSKVCSWMAAQEEEFRFIILVGDGRDSPWSRICASQADCTLLVADPACTAPQVSTQEQALVWQSISRAASLVTRSSTLPDLLADAAWKLLGQEGLNSLLGEGAAQGGGSPSGTAGAASLSLSALMRVELVLVHAMDGVPSGTAAWLDARPLLTRHHHIRLGFEPDMARLSRWMADRAVGVVLSGGGSRGLAHQGVLNALADAGVPIDVVGGTSQGAFMGGLYAQNLRRSAMEDAVRRYATEMGSVRKLLMDLTLPIISVFNGAGFDRVVREALGLQRIEDLWLRFFCVSTNLSRGAPSVHERGLLWKMCRASMTIVGLVPPVFHAGDLLVDGGYLNNIPVDVMHGLGVGTVIVVDVEDRDQSAWHNLTPYDGGVSGWQLLWDRWCPVEAWRYNVRIPRYSQLMNSLTWMSHQQTLRRVSQEYVIDLYLRPPVFHYRLMDYYLAERIVREASQYAWVVVSEWQAKIGIHRTGLAGLLHADSAGFPRTPSSLTLVDRSRSSACMTQLQGKQRGRVAFGPRNASLELPRGLSKSLEEQPAHLLGPLGPDTLHTYQSLPLALQGRGGRRRARRADAVQGSGSVAGFATMPPPATDHLPTLSRMAGKRGGAEEGGEGAWGADPEGEILFPISDVGEEFGSPGASLGSGA
ncbi:hypothetical protein APUTEX25_000030, partial [Auxenochlorella protothecoides]